MQPVELLPLAAGLSEEVPVICNGRSGILLLRSQRILHNGSTMSASRFETIRQGRCKKVEVQRAPGALPRGVWPGAAWECGAHTYTMLGSQCQPRVQDKHVAVPVAERRQKRSTCVPLGACRELGHGLVGHAEATLQSHV